MKTTDQVSKHISREMKTKENQNDQRSFDKLLPENFENANVVADKLYSYLRDEVIGKYVGGVQERIAIKKAIKHNIREIVRTTMMDVSNGLSKQLNEIIDY